MLTCKTKDNCNQAVINLAIKPGCFFATNLEKKILRYEILASKTLKPKIRHKVNNNYCWLFIHTWYYQKYVNITYCNATRQRSKKGLNQRKSHANNNKKEKGTREAPMLTESHDFFISQKVLIWNMHLLAFIVLHGGDVAKSRFCFFVGGLNGHHARVSQIWTVTTQNCYV